MLDGFDLDVQSWSFWIWWLYAFAVYCLVGFLWFWVRLQGLYRGAAEGLPAQVERYNRALQGFPNAVFAKMMGRSAIEAT